MHPSGFGRIYCYDSVLSPEALPLAWQGHTLKDKENAQDGHSNRNPYR